MNIWYIFWIALPVVIIIISVVIYFIRKRLAARVKEQKAMINQHKMNANIFVIEKKHAKMSDANMPKQVLEQMPKLLKFKKMPLVTAKVGPQVVTLVCDEDVFKKIPERKNVNVDLAGIFIAEIKQTGHGHGPQKKKKRK
ncbi:MAG: hypothetical protein JW982_00280 [Spirochaetes bacterium]|nr:hypothetical protein [Spirochaetota bacterium]